jgi:hypothetical protein
MTTDLTGRLRHDPAFFDRLERMVRRMQYLESTPTGSDSKEFQQLFINVLEHCDYNAGLLVPYYYPKFAMDSEGAWQPMSLLDRPFALAFFEMQVHGTVTVRTGRQVGKSSTMIAAQSIYTNIFPNFSDMYITTHSDYLDQYANRFKKMERMFRFNTKRPDLRNNLTFKELPNGSTIELLRVYEDPDTARGHSADCQRIDEAQHMDPEFEPVLDQCLKASKIPSKYYAGTSLTLETFLESKYQEGSKGVWMLPCPDGKNWINCGDPEDVLPCIQQDGLVCRHTGKLLRVEDGEYVHADQQAFRLGNRSYHTPQIIVPEYANNLNKWFTEIYRDYLRYPRAKFLQEIMGIPTEEGYREITQDDLVRMCCLPDTVHGLLARAQKHHYRHVISGCDWGGSDYNAVAKTKVSWTFHTIIGVTQDRNIDILHMRKYGGMKYEEICHNIIQDHVRYKATVMASDSGGGLAYNSYLRSSGDIRPEQHLILHYTVPNSALFAKLKDQKGMFNEYGLNRTESITTLFEAIKRRPDPRIRCFSWDLARQYLMDFMHLYRDLVVSESGNQKFRYRRHGSKADDCVHSMNYAYVAARVLMGEPLIDDRGLRDHVLQLLTGTGNSFGDGTNTNPWMPGYSG